MDTVTALGFTGAFLILLAFIMNQLKFLGREDFAYDALNAVGGMILVGYALIIGSYPFLLLNGVWALISLRDVVRKRKEKNAKEN
ncbi:MAG: hypothetical protein UY99_C0021G0006 [Parcubacteria group bacterium GW2011_GWA1_59_11]|nr:MAG: hypothetical protein UY99_C0021G0006 [Parcubacteria group bacterium GW2011_GWA1_59_11]